MKKPYKVEAKGSLFEVTFESGEYSDWHIEHYIFSGNTADEVWESVKIWAINGGLDNDYHFVLVWEESDKRFQYGKKDFNEKINWRTSYGDALLVKITRAEVIYVKINKDNLEKDFNEKKD